MNIIQQNENELNDFLEYCKLDKDFIKISTFKNSVIVHFEKTIFSDIYEKLRKLNNRVMIYRQIDVITERSVLCLFIYKHIIFNYESN